MDNKLNKLTEEKQYVDSNKLPQPERKPDDLSGLNVEAKIKISDPVSGEVILEGRA